MLRLIGIFCLTFIGYLSNAQVILDADGPGNTYELINSVLAPGYNVVESPDCNHALFGRHIDEVYDSDLSTNVFRFYIHVSPDDDRCINVDRQRNEIKTYDQSPDNLKGVQGETVEYKWKFKLDAGFQPSSSFTHIHQLKAVGGTESSMPSITLTPRKATPNRLELRYAETTSQVTLTQVDLAPFLGEWVEVTQTVLYGESGTYDLEIKKVSDATVLMSYTNNSIRMWKTGASFIRPKWGIYRSLNDVASLRDEAVLFANFSIHELPSAPIELASFYLQSNERKQIAINWSTLSEINNDYFIIEKSKDAEQWQSLTRVEGAGNSTELLNYMYLDENPFPHVNYYRIKQVDLDGTYSYSFIQSLEMPLEKIKAFPNPSQDDVYIETQNLNIENIHLFNSEGKDFIDDISINHQGDDQLRINIQNLANGVYFLFINNKMTKLYKM